MQARWKTCARWQGRALRACKALQQNGFACAFPNLLQLVLGIQLYLQWCLLLVVLRVAVQLFQQFLGCTNWLRFYMMPMYSTLCKILGQFLKPGAELPAQGIGAGNEVYNKAVKGIKIMA